VLLRPPVWSSSTRTGADPACDFGSRPDKNDDGPNSKNGSNARECRGCQSTRGAGVRHRKRTRALYCASAVYVTHFPTMKTLTVRLPEDLIAQIEAESRRRRLSKSDVVRERLTETKRSRGHRSTLLDAVANVIGSIDQLPSDLSPRKEKHLRSTGYGTKRSG
jgi:Arc/MetJ-type ribon-helix-helix transcriptional regulator